MSCNLEVTYLEVTNLCFVNVISFVYRYYNNYDRRLSQADKSQEMKILLGGVTCISRYSSPSESEST